ncbi:MAG: hypothetical protein ABSA83_14295 [Verrucomicrobiota bacterium]
MLALCALLWSVPALCQSGSPVPFDQVPQHATFFSAQGRPPLPYDWDTNCQVYSLGNGQFVVDDSSVIYSNAVPGQRSLRRLSGNSSPETSSVNQASPSTNNYSFPAVPETLVLITSDPIPTQGNFWSMKGNLPPLPTDPLPQLNLYTDGTPGNWWYDDRDYDYSANSANAATTTSRRALGAYSTGGESSSYGPSMPPGALWLQITGTTNSIVSLNLNGATDTVYEVWSKPNLEQTNWNIETEVFPTNQQAMPFAVNQQSRGTLFLWARDWTGITSDGNETPEWWFFYYFGTTALSDTNLDVNGNTLLYDYTNSIDPNLINGLWLQVLGITNDVLFLSLNNATNLVYEIFSTTSLGNPPTSWNIEQAVWPTSETVSPFCVCQGQRTNCLFLWARDWTGVTSDGNQTPEWWFWENFGRVDLSDTDVDGAGNTLWFDYQNGIDPSADAVHCCPN